MRQKYKVGQYLHSISGINKLTNCKDRKQKICHDLNIRQGLKKIMKYEVTITVIVFAIASSLIILSLMPDSVTAQLQNANNTKLVVNLKNHTISVIDKTTNNTISVSNYTVPQGNFTGNETIAINNTLGNRQNATNNEIPAINAHNTTTNENLTTRLKNLQGK
jgi:hypothetical protein